MTHRTEETVLICRFTNHDEIPAQHNKITYSSSNRRGKPINKIDIKLRIINLIQMNETNGKREARNGLIIDKRSKERKNGNTAEGMAKGKRSTEPRRGETDEE